MKLQALLLTFATLTASIQLHADLNDFFTNHPEKFANSFTLGETSSYTTKGTYYDTTHIYKNQDGVIELITLSRFHPIILSDGELERAKERAAQSDSWLSNDNDSVQTDFISDPNNRELITEIVKRTQRYDTFKKLDSWKIRTSERHAKEIREERQTKSSESK
jgi:hypothetical protein